MRFGPLAPIGHGHDAGSGIQRDHRMIKFGCTDAGTFLFIELGDFARPSPSPHAGRTITPTRCGVFTLHLEVRIGERFLGRPPAQIGHIDPHDRPAGEILSGEKSTMRPAMRDR